MSVPTVPTVNSLLTEAFRRCGIPSPTVAQLLRAEDEWLEEVKQELHVDKRWHNMEETMVLIPQAYIQVYPIPSPLFRVLAVRFYDGDAKGTATAATATSITLASTGDFLGRKIFITGGTGAAQVNRITSMAGNVATVACTWATTPDATSTYMVASTEQPVLGPELGLNRLGVGATNLIQLWEQFESQLIFWPIPNASTYALEIQGTVDISLVDETDARLTRVLREWRVAIVHGVMMRIKEEQNDDTLMVTKALYDEDKLRLKIADSRKRRALRPIAMRSPGGMPRRRY